MIPKGEGPEPPESGTAQVWTFLACPLATRRWIHTATSRNSTPMTRTKNAAGGDFGDAGIDIQSAMIAHVQAHPDRATRSKYILWNGRAVWTGIELHVPRQSRFQVEFLSEPRDPAQGVDVKAEDGAIMLPSGESVQTLRTWHAPRYEPVVEYPFISKAGLLKVWNVYHRLWPDGRITEEKWTGNAGFLVEEESERRWLFRCSDGPSRTPDFEQLVFRLSIVGG